MSTSAVVVGRSRLYFLSSDCVLSVSSLKIVSQKNGVITQSYSSHVGKLLLACHGTLPPAGAMARCRGIAIYTSSGTRVIPMWVTSAPNEDIDIGTKERKKLEGVVVEPSMRGLISRLLQLIPLTCTVFRDFVPFFGNNQGGGIRLIRLISGFGHNLSDCPTESD